MRAALGFRSNRVFVNQTSGVLDEQGAFLYVEVDSTVDTLFFVNPFDVSGKQAPTAPEGIPIKAGVTRIIPMAVYNFKANAPVTVVAYRM